jgi:hypothetical protein
MENLNIEGSKTLPTIDFDTSGHLKMQGRIITENANVTFAPLIEWAKNIEVEKVTFDIELDYLNTSASMQLYSLLKELEENKSIKTLNINWHYDEDDEDHLETGQFFEERLTRGKFKYVKVADHDRD